MNLFNTSNLPTISNQVEDQFPSFYKEHGPGFIDFVETYYKWMEDPDNPVGQARRLYDQFDIDRATKEFLQHYREKYMWGLPPELLGDQRLLQKHILELYRSKGSQQATKLLFRLLFNEDIDFYVPSYDIFKLSDNTWSEPNFLEVTWTPHFDDYINSAVTGGTSGASAVVESYESRYINGKMIHLLFISNIIGKFIPDESVITDGVLPYLAPTIIGSPVGLTITSAPDGFDIGSTLTSDRGERPIQLAVSALTSGSGILNFRVEAPGSYYTLDAVIETPLMPSGGGAEIRVRTLKNTHSYFYVHDKVIDHVNTRLDGIYTEFVSKPDSDINTIIEESLISEWLVVGEIDTITILHPGNGYEDFVYFYPVDPYTSTSGRRDSDGNLYGANARIRGTPVIGVGIPSDVKVISSGYNNIYDDEVTFIANEGVGLQITGRVIRGAVGKDLGYYENTKSFLSDDKYLFDGHYYQDYSYVIRASKTLDSYVDVLKSLTHPAGNVVYGDIRIFIENGLHNDAIVTRVSSEPNEDLLLYDDVIENQEEHLWLSTDINNEEYQGTASVVD